MVLTAKALDEIDLVEEDATEGGLGAAMGGARQHKELADADKLGVEGLVLVKKAAEGEVLLLTTGISNRLGRVEERLEVLGTDERRRKRILYTDNVYREISFGKAMRKSSGEDEMRGGRKVSVGRGYRRIGRDIAELNEQRRVVEHGVLDGLKEGLGGDLLELTNAKGAKGTLGRATGNRLNESALGSWICLVLLEVDLGSMRGKRGGQEGLNTEDQEEKITKKRRDKRKVYLGEEAMLSDDLAEGEDGVAELVALEGKELEDAVGGREEANEQRSDGWI